MWCRCWSCKCIWSTYWWCLIQFRRRGKYDLLRNCSHGTFPVVDTASSGTLFGTASRDMLFADLKTLDEFKAGFDIPIAMSDGYGFDGAKAYKYSKLCLMMMSNVLHSKYHKLTGIAFSSSYPGCIAKSPFFREKRKRFRKYFPVFMKYIAGGFVSEQEAGQRLFQVAHDPRCTKSGGKQKTLQNISSCCTV